MNMGNFWAPGSCFRFFRRALLVSPGRNRARQRFVFSLCSMALTAPASALVGPAREAPQYAPYVVVVLDRTAGEADFCTASVVARNVVLTAAHCVGSPADMRGSYRGIWGRRVFVGVEKTAINPNYKPDASRQGAFSIDLALLLLSEPLPQKFRPVELDGAGPVAVGQHVQIAGF